jgi:Flp pilus assembly protein TadG
MLRSKLFRLRRRPAARRGDERGAVAILFALMLVPLVAATGAAIDYARGVEFRSALQAAADDAALAGASAYTTLGSVGQSQGTAAATNYMEKAISGLPPNSGVSFTATPGTTGSGSTLTAFTVTVSATGTVPNTLMSLWQSAMTVTVSATASNPVVTAVFNTGGFVSYACDTNIVYWYIVPANGGVPAAAAMNQLWSNNNANPPSKVTFQVLASQKIGFALENITDARPPALGGCNYGNNMYGSRPGDTQWFYSSLQPPAASYNIAPGGIPTGTHGSYPTTQDCSLVVEKGTPKNGATSFPSAPQGSCFSTSGKRENLYNAQSGNCSGCGTGPTMATEMTDAAPSCTQLGSNIYQYDWNDMGGIPETYNYGNDMQYTFSCSGAGTSASGIALTQ